MRPGIFRNENRGDFLLTFIAVGIILLAAGITVGKVKNDDHSATAVSITDPIAIAEEAAYAGIQAAKGHIECHGPRERGALPKQFYANGGRFKVVWDDFNPADSTIRVMAYGYCDMPSTEGENGWTYTTRLESVIKIDRAISNGQKRILRHFYDKQYRGSSDVE